MIPVMRARFVLGPSFVQTMIIIPDRKTFSFMKTEFSAHKMWRNTKGLLAPIPNYSTFVLRTSVRPVEECLKFYFSDSEATISSL